MTIQELEKELKLKVVIIIISTKGEKTCEYWVLTRGME